MKFAVIFILITLICFPCAQGSKSGSQHFKIHDIMESIGLIMAYDSAGKTWQPFGTGVFIDPDSSLPFIFFITNRHIFIARDSFKIIVHLYKKKDSIFIYHEDEINYKKPGLAFCPSTEDSDFAAIAIARFPDSLEFSPIKKELFIAFDDLGYGMQAEFYGYPSFKEFGLFKGFYDFPVLRSGELAYFANNDVFYNNRKIMIPGMFLLDGVSIGGNSGGPVFIRVPVIKGVTISDYIRPLAGIISGHYPIIKSQIIPLSKLHVASVTIDSTLSSRDSLLLSKILSDFQFEYEENSNLAIVISINIITQYIDRMIKETKQN